MKIKRGLVFNKRTGQLTGFVELGSVNEILNVCLLRRMTTLRAET